MEVARRKELEFFKASPHYSGLKNIGTGFLSGKLSSHLIGAIRKQLPVIQHSINDGIVDMERELEALGGPGATTRGAMVHLVLQACDKHSGPWLAPDIHCGRRVLKAVRDLYATAYAKQAHCGRRMPPSVADAHIIASITHDRCVTG